MKNDVHVLVRCPQCGGDIDFLEETQVIRCEYCGISLLVSGRRGILRYVIPPRITSPAEIRKRALSYLKGKGFQAPRVAETFLFYAPFWRIQMAVYRWIFGQKPMKVKAWSGNPPPTERVKVLVTRVMDHSIPGFSDIDVGLYTLGVRSQVLQMQAFTKEHLDMRSSFLPLEVGFQKVHEEAVRLSEAFLDPDDITPEVILHRLVGQRYSVVYFPLWYVECREGSSGRTLLFDAVGGDVAKSPADGGSLMLKLMGESSRKTFKFSEIKFLPFRCPNCGWDFPFRPLSVLHFCPTCHQLWKEQRRRWSPVPYGAVPLTKGRKAEGVLWFPFWRFRAVLESSGSRVENMADLYRLAPPPRALDLSRETQRPIFFYIPAARFRNPKALHDLASRFTFLQPQLPEEAPFPEVQKPNTAGVNLSETDARELGLVVLGAMIPPKNRRARAWLKGCRVRLMDAKLLYLPFNRLHLFWKEQWTGLTFQKNALSEDLPED